MNPLVRFNAPLGLSTGLRYSVGTNSGMMSLNVRNVMGNSIYDLNKGNFIFLLKNIIFRGSYESF